MNMNMKTGNIRLKINNATTPVINHKTIHIQYKVDDSADVEMYDTSNQS